MRSCKMKEIQVIIKNGFDASQAALFVQTASKFKSHITLTLDNKVANAKSIMGMISLGLIDESKITITAQGDDEEEAVATLIDFVK